MRNLILKSSVFRFRVRFVKSRRHPMNGRHHRTGSGALDSLIPGFFSPPKKERKGKKTVAKRRVMKQMLKAHQADFRVSARVSCLCFAQDRSSRNPDSKSYTTLSTIACIWPWNQCDKQILGQNCHQQNRHWTPFAIRRTQRKTLFPWILRKWITVVFGFFAEHGERYFRRNVKESFTLRFAFCVGCAEGVCWPKLPPWARKHHACFCVFPLDMILTNPDLIAGIMTLYETNVNLKCDVAVNSHYIGAGADSGDGVQEFRGPTFGKLTLASLCRVCRHFWHFQLKTWWKSHWCRGQSHRLFGNLAFLLFAVLGLKFHTKIAIFH